MNYSHSVFHNKMITSGENYTLNYTFTSNADLDTLWVVFVDITTLVVTRLTPDIHIKRLVKANIEYSGSVTLIANKTTSSKEPNANLISINTHPYTGNQPTLTFTRFELVNNS